MQEGSKQCVSCAAEALGLSKIFIREAMQGRSEEERMNKLRDAVFELKHSEWHLFRRFGKVSDEIRDLRKSFEYCIFGGGRDCEPDALNVILSKLERLIDKVTSLGRIKIPKFRGKSYFLLRKGKSNINAYKETVAFSIPEIQDNSRVEEQNMEGNKKMTVKDTGMIAKILGFQFGGLVLTQLTPKLDEYTGTTTAPLASKTSTWTNFGIGLLSIYLGATSKSGIFAKNSIPFVILGGQVLAQQVMAFVQPYFLGTTPSVRYRLVGAPIGGPVAATPSALGGRVRDYTGGV